MSNGQKSSRGEEIPRDSKALKKIQELSDEDRSQALRQLDDLLDYVESQGLV